MLLPGSIAYMYNYWHGTSTQVFLRKPRKFLHHILPPPPFSLSFSLAPSLSFSLLNPYHCTIGPVLSPTPEGDARLSRYLTDQSLPHVQDR